MPWWHHALIRHLLTMSSRFGFSKAAATRSLSFSCLFTAASVECAPGVIYMSTCAQQQSNHADTESICISTCMLNCLAHKLTTTSFSQVVCTEGAGKLHPTRSCACQGNAKIPPKMLGSEQQAMQNGPNMRKPLEDMRLP